MAETRTIRITRQEPVEEQVTVELPAYFWYELVDDYFRIQVWVRVTADGRELSVSRGSHTHTSGGDKIEWEFELIEGVLEARLASNMEDSTIYPSTSEEYSRAAAAALHEIGEALGKSAGVDVKQEKS